jgi:putative DNA primase/helicase
MRLLKEFPFIEDKDLSVAIAQVITLVVRPATETAPLIATTAPTRGSGKSKIGDVAAAIGTGRPCTVLSATADPIELEKRIGGIMLSGDPLVSLDNVNGVLRSDLLCQAITAPAVKVRRLGSSDPIEVPNVATWLANGNNLNLAGDLARRAILCRLDPGMERPEERVFSFDPAAVALEHRSEYVSAVLTLVRAFILAGSPDLGLEAVRLIRDVVPDGP